MGMLPTQRELCRACPSCSGSARLRPISVLRFWISTEGLTQAES